MARNQGLVRLSHGVTRPLQQSEIERGYIYVTKDRALIDDCQGKLHVVINDIPIGERSLDDYGRIFPRMSFPETLRTSTTVMMQYDKPANTLSVTLTN